MGYFDPDNETNIKFSENAFSSQSDTNTDDVEQEQTTALNEEASASEIFEGGKKNVSKAGRSIEETKDTSEDCQTYEQLSQPHEVSDPVIENDSASMIIEEASVAYDETSRDFYGHVDEACVSGIYEGNQKDVSKACKERNNEETNEDDCQTYTQFSQPYEVSDAPIDDETASMRYERASEGYDETSHGNVDDVETGYTTEGDIEPYDQTDYDSTSIYMQATGDDLLMEEVSPVCIFFLNLYDQTNYYYLGILN